MQIPIQASLCLAILHLLSTAITASPLPAPGWGGNSPGALFPGGIASSFVKAFKTSNLGNAEYTCSRNGLPCNSAVDVDGGEGQYVEAGLVDNVYGDGPDEAGEDGVYSTGGLDRYQYVDEEGVERTVIEGEIFNHRVDNYADAAFSDELIGDEAYLEVADIEAPVSFQSLDRSFTCTRNGYPCGSFPEGFQRELNLERTSSCTRNGVPCGDYVDGVDDDERFTIEKNNDSYKSCTRNGMPCEEYEKLVAAGELPENNNDYRVSTGNAAAPKELEKTIQSGEGKPGNRPINITN